jgi:hypothetical protein
MNTASKAVTVPETNTLFSHTLLSMASFGEIVIKGLCPCGRSSYSTTTAYVIQRDQGIVSLPGLTYITVVKRRHYFPPYD